MDKDVLGWRPIAQAWMENRNQQEVHVSLVPCTQNHSQRKLKLVSLFLIQSIDVPLLVSLFLLQTIDVPLLVWYMLYIIIKYVFLLARC